MLPPAVAPLQLPLLLQLSLDQALLTFAYSRHPYLIRCMQK